MNTNPELPSLLLPFLTMFRSDSRHVMPFDEKRKKKRLKRMTIHNKREAWPIYTRSPPLHPVSASRDLCL